MKGNNSNYFVEFMAQEMINKGLEESCLDNLIANLESIICGSGLELLTAILRMLLSAIEDDMNNQNRISKVSQIIQKLLFCYKDCVKLAFIVSNAFEGINSPISEILALLPLDLEISLSFALLSGKFENEAKKFIKDNNLVEKMKESTDNLPIPQFQFEFAVSEQNNALNHSKPNKFYNFPYINEDHNLQIFLELKEKNEIKISEIIKELDETTFLSLERMKRIFTFYNKFDEMDAAKVLYTFINMNLNFNKNNFKEVFSIFKTIFKEKGLEFIKIFKSFDNLIFEKLAQKPISLLFSCFSVFFDEKKIDVNLLLDKWENEELQYSILFACTQTSLEGVDFRNTDKVDIKDISIDQLINEKNNYCWHSQKFCEVIFSLASTSITRLRELTVHISLFSSTYSFIILGFEKIPKTEEILNFSKDILSKMLFPSVNKNAINTLWNLCPKYLLKIFALLPRSIEQHITKIVEALSNHIEEAITSDEYSFSIDISAFLISTQRCMNAFDTLIGAFDEEHVIKIVDIFVEKVLDNMIQLCDVAVNAFFTSINEHFQSYSQTSKLFIHDSYTRCHIMRPSTISIPFQIDIIKEQKNESNNKCESLFNSFIEGNKTHDSLFNHLIESRITDPLLHRLLITRILDEFEKLSTRSNEAIQNFFLLLQKVFRYRYLSEEQVESIYNFLYDAASSSQDNLTPYAFSFIKNMAKCMVENPRFVYRMIKETSISTQDPELYEILITLAKEMPEPPRATMVRTIPINKKLVRFGHLSRTPPRVQDAIKRIRKDSSELRLVIDSLTQFYDWIALELVKMLEDHPLLVKEVCKTILSLNNSKFRTVVVDAASYLATKQMLDPKFDSEEVSGCLLRRGTRVLGQIIGKLTLGSKNYLSLSSMDLKHVLLYGFSQGRLYGIIPFVVEILDAADPFFLPPNPYTSGILYIIAQISKTNSLKSSITNSITKIFEKMKINITMFAELPFIFPEKVKNNKDFIVAPFSLFHFAQPNEVEKILNFEESAFFKFSMQHVIFPDSPVLQNKPDLRDKLSPIIAQQAYEFIRTEGLSMANIAASTATELVEKDFSSTFDRKFTISTAEKMVAQLVSSLTLFTAPAKLSKRLFSCITCECDNEEEQEYLNLVTQKNYEWITQFLEDVVKIIAMRKVRKSMETSKYKIKNLSIYGFNGIQLQTQHYIIYSTLLNETTSQQPFPILELLQAQDNSIHQDPEFVKFLERFTKLIPPETSHSHIIDQGPNYYESAIAMLMKHCPDLSNVPVDIERFRSIMKALLQNVTSINYDIIDKAFCKIIEKILPYVPLSVIEQAKPFFKLWIQTTIRSHIIICEFLRLKLITEEMLDTIFPPMLEAYPLNARNVCFIIDVLHYGIFKKKVMNPNSFVKTLSSLSHVIPSNIDNPSTGILQPGSQAPEFQMLEDLNKVFFSLDLHCREGCNYPKYDEEIAILIKLYLNKTDYDLNEFVKRCLSIGKNFFLSLFRYQEEKIVLFFMGCLKKTNVIKEQFVSILQIVAEFIIESLQTKDINTIFEVILYIINNIEHNEENITKFAAFLHIIRPIKAPWFTFAWIQLAASKMMTTMLLEEIKTGECPFSILLTDFISIVKSIDALSNPSVFQKINVALLRYVVIISHDYPELMAKLRISIVPLLPPSFRQLKNVINSVESPQTIKESIIEEIMSSRPQEFLELQKSLKDKDTPLDKSIEKLISYVEDKCIEQGLFIKCILHTESDPEREIEIINKFLEKCAVHTAILIIESIIDMLASESDETKYGVELLSLLVKNTAVFKGSKVCPAELAIKLLLERCKVEGPTPWGLKTAAERILGEKSHVYGYSFVIRSQKVTNELKSTYNFIHTKEQI